MVQYFPPIIILHLAKSSELIGRLSIIMLAEFIRSAAARADPRLF